MLEQVVQQKNIQTDSGLYSGLDTHENGHHQKQQHKNQWQK